MADSTKSKNPNKVVRKRAPKACLSCRARKVRCDVSQRGRPCMNCYLDSETCVVTGRASRFRRQREGHDHVQASYPPYDKGNGKLSAEDVVKSRLDGIAPSASAGKGNAQHSHNKSHEADIVNGTVNTSDLTLNQNGGDDLAGEPLQDGQQEPTLQLSPAPAPPPPAPSVRPQSTHASRNTGSHANDHNTTFATQQWSSGVDPISTQSDVVYSYYPFVVVSNLPNIPAQDVNFLESQGCLRLPTRGLLDEFLQQYFMHVHPLLPLVNEGDFWDVYCQNPHSMAMTESISLLVLQAILFASCNFVSKSTIRALGFSNIRSARAMLYRRSKLLYDLETETSPPAIAQAALLLSFWAPSSTRNPNTSWLSLAIQHAKAAEAHHYAAMPVFSADTHPLQHKKQNILKRIWWGCIIRDRTLGLLMRRPIQITKDHFDFDANPVLGFSDLADEFSRSKVYNSETKKGLVEILSQIIELYVILTDILILVFPLDDTPGWGRQIPPEDSCRAQAGKAALRRWYKSAALHFPMFGGNPAARVASETKGHQHDSIILYTNLMYMYYHSTRVVLCHHEVLQLAITTTVPKADRIAASPKDLSIMYESKNELQDAAAGVTECLKELVQLKLARWLPISAVACTALPLVLNILDVKLSSSSAKNPTFDSYTASAWKQHRLNILIEAMKTYQPQYHGVDWVSEIIRHVVNLAQVDGTKNTDGNPSNITDWTDILASQPSSYLRLALALDLSLSKGRLPEDADFPVSLRGLFTGGFSPLKALVEANRGNNTNNDPLMSTAGSSNGGNTFAHHGHHHHHHSNNYGGSSQNGMMEDASHNDASSTRSYSDSIISNQHMGDEVGSTHLRHEAEALRNQVRSQIAARPQSNTNMPPSEGLSTLLGGGVHGPNGAIVAGSGAAGAGHLVGGGGSGSGGDVFSSLAVGGGGGGGLNDDESPSAGSDDFGAMYIDGPMPDISAEWIENVWDEMEDLENKNDRDTARVLLEALKEGDVSSSMI